MLWQCKKNLATLPKFLILHNFGWLDYTFTTQLVIKNAPHLLHFGYTFNSHTLSTHLLHFVYTIFSHTLTTQLVIKNAPHLLHFGYTPISHTSCTHLLHFVYTFLSHTLYTLTTPLFFHSSTIHFQLFYYTLTTLFVWCYHWITYHKPVFLSQLL